MIQDRNCIFTTLNKTRAAERRSLRTLESVTRANKGRQGLGSGQQDQCRCLFVDRAGIATDLEDIYHHNRSGIIHTMHTPEQGWPGINTTVLHLGPDFFRTGFTFSLQHPALASGWMLNCTCSEAIC